MTKKIIFLSFKNLCVKQRLHIIKSLGTDKLPKYSLSMLHQSPVAIKAERETANSSLTPVCNRTMSS